MTTPSDMNLTDEQYRRILEKMRVTLAQDDFQVGCSDCTVTGYKSTDSNCGFCCDAYTEEDTALFPAQFPERKSMKYRRENHRCPFDLRKTPHTFSWGSGCFFQCYLFAHLRNRDWDLGVMRGMVDQTIQALDRKEVGNGVH